MLMLSLTVVGHPEHVYMPTVESQVSVKLWPFSQSMCLFYNLKIKYQIWNITAISFLIQPKSEQALGIVLI